jgi:hypothetical protein
MMTIKKTGGVFGRHPSFQSVSAESYQVEPGGIITDATTSRTLSAADNGKVIYFTSGSAVTVTTAAGLGKGFSCTIIQGGAGEIAVAEGGSTSLISFGGINSTDGQYSTASLFCPADDTFLFSCTRNTKAAVEYLLVAGGGGAGSSFDNFGGGGGGAGGYLTGSNLELTVKTTLPIVIGAGGAGALADGTLATNGNNSVIDTLTSIGGGRGGQPLGGNFNGVAGGSGGGGAGYFMSPAGTGGSGTTGQGFAGGNGQVGGGQNAGGGGGASAAGVPLTGGAGASNSITGSAVTYATGGRGGSGAAGFSQDGPDGAANTGNGGGGPYRFGESIHRPGGNGGSGFAVIKVPSWVAATFSAGVTYTLNTSVSGFNIYEITATSTTDETVTLEP